MTRVIVLDTGPLGLLSNPRATPETRNCGEWFLARLGAGDRFVIPEIADYEVRRELLRASKHAGLHRLDALQGQATYISLTTAAMRMAAQLWAQVRQQGRPTAPDPALDGDVIVAAQANLLTGSEDEVVIATTNVRHLALFAPARDWRDI